MSTFLKILALVYSFQTGDGPNVCVYNLDGRSYTVTRAGECDSQITIDLRTMKVVAAGSPS